MEMLGSLLQEVGKDRFEDFARRWEQGAPWDTLQDDETISLYDRIVDEIGPAAFEEAALASLDRLSSQERRALVSEMQANGRRQDLNYPGVHEEGLDAPRKLAGLLSRMHGERRGMIRQFLAASESTPETGGILSSPTARATLAGIAVMAVRQAGRSGLASRRS
ncbi:hypothetical protein [Anaeromyxobacter oryzisoli]|uniref:hypothetical protein n=1 Tax=Anaeromyxobacter oryzisoli TaxID=2925408 RepID=UPI001F566B68|nr:hypothetical protein [Anaeromyxobacter sp. SG63]